MKDKISYNKPFLVGKEIYNISQAVIKYKRLSGDGHFTRQCQAWLEKELVATKALLTNSCTGALEMAAILSEIKPGDEIILPSYTFVSTANAFVLRGGVPVFIDIRPDTLNINEKKIEEAITDKTKAIVPVHYAGVPCEMDYINEIAKNYNLIVIEDAAQALLSRYKKNHLGTIGDFGAISFHETKNIISGEGGALLINNEKYIERAEIIWEKGTNRKKFFRGEIDKYTWVDLGSSFLPSEITASFLHAQLERSKEIIKRRAELADQYKKTLNTLSQKGVRLPFVPAYAEANGHIFYIITRSIEERSDLISHLNAQGIKSVFHYVPLHSSPAGLRFGRVSGQMKYTDDLSDRVLRLPLYYEMTDEELKRVCDSLFEYYQIK